MDGPGIKSRLGEIFRTSPERTLVPPSLLCNGNRFFPVELNWQGCDCDHTHPSVAVSKEELRCNPTPPTVRTASTEPLCLYKGALCLFYVESHSDLKGITTGRHVLLLGYDVVDI